MSIYAVPAMLNADAYKSGHMAQYPKGMTKIMLNMTPRSDKWFNTPLKVDGVLAMGFQRFAKDYLKNHWDTTFFSRDKQSAVDEAVNLMNGVVFGSPVKRENLEALHDLGYLPVALYAVPEGTLVKIKTPMCVLVNTHDDFAWVAGYLEDVISNELWKVTTIATTALHYKRIFTKWADKTCENRDHIPYQGHDFALRGLSGITDGGLNQIGHLSCFMGTDSFPAVYTAKRVYGEGMEYSEIGSTIPATEHTVMCANIAVEMKNIQKTVGHGLPNKNILRAVAETEVFRKLLTETYPTGLVSIVSDTYNYWDTISNKLSSLKDIIKGRDGKLVIRPDSGNPFHVVCGYDVVGEPFAKLIIENRMVNRGINVDFAAFRKQGLSEDFKTYANLLADDYDLVYFKEEDKYFNLKTGEFRTMSRAEVIGTMDSLFEIFGGKENSKGFVELDPHIGLIYGDSVTLELADKILEKMADKGYASNNIVFGIGSFTYQFMTRDTFGFAVKGTGANIDSEFLALSKDPITDQGLKKSAEGCTQLIKGELVDGLTFEEWDEQYLASDFVCYFMESVTPTEYTLKHIRKNVDSIL